MKLLGTKVFSFLSSNSNTIDKYSVDQIRKDDGVKVDTNKQLIKLIAEISFHNPQYSLFYRGQDDDYLNKVQASSLYPSMFRPRITLPSLVSGRYYYMKLGGKYLLTVISPLKFAGKD